MKRTSSSDGGSETNRLESYPSSSHYTQQQALSPQKQKQFHAQQQMQQQQYQVQQQQHLQMQQQIQEFQQQQQQQQIQEYQKQQQFAANQQFYNQAAFYNYQAYVPSQSPLLYNSGPSWNYIATPPPFFGPNSSPSTPQPPLPPPELKPEKPPLPKEPEPGNENLVGNRAGGTGTINSGSNGPRAQGGIRVRGLNGINAGTFNGINGGVRQKNATGGNPGTSQRGRRRNPHFFSQMQPPSAPSNQDLTQASDFSDLAQLLEEDIPAGTEKFTIFLNNSENGRVQVNKKAKRKPMSTRYTRTKLWVREEAEAALALEKEFNRMQKRPMLILKFPDPDLNKYIVKRYSPFIDTVHFQQPSTPRYCFVQLKEGADVDKVVNTIRQIPFGTGKISAEVKSQHLDDQPVSPEEIDPYTLYIGNLPTHISVRVVKQYFPNAQRIDIGYAQRMRYTRYAFIRYNSVAEAMESYRKTVNALLDSRSLIVRFRRQKGNIGLPGEPKLKLQKREDKEETAPKEQNATENQNEVQIAEDLTEEDQSVREDNEGAKVGDAIEKQEIVSKERLSTEDDEIPKCITETVEERQAPNTIALNENAKDVTVNKESTAPVPRQKEIANAEAQETSTTLYSPESLGDEVDNKEKVLEKARELMKKNKERRAVSPINFSAFAEPTDLIKGPVEGDIKLEQTDEEDSSDDGGINLLGTRVKDEPFETPHRAPMDELYFDDYDYDDLCTDIDDDDDNWSNNSDSRSRQLLTTNWEIVRRSELNVREDKPDLTDIGSTGADSMQNSIGIAPIKANLELKQEIDDLDQQAAKKMKRDRLAVKQELEDMFNRLNSDIECDDEDAFFGHI